MFFMYVTLTCINIHMIVLHLSLFLLALRHPHVVTMYEAFPLDPEMPHLAVSMEFCTGGDLLKKAGQLSPAEEDVSCICFLISQNKTKQTSTNN